jgi:hypothetical protein
MGALRDSYKHYIASICRELGSSRISISLHAEEREMGAASMVSLGEFRQARFHAEARQRLYEHLDRWLDRVESA